MVASAGAKQCFIDLAKTRRDEKALRICNKILRNYPKETLAFKCKLIALIRLGQFDDALTLIKKTPPHQMGDCLFEKAYIQYRINDDAASLETIEKIVDKDQLKVIELRTQILYRCGHYEEAVEIYKKLLKDHSGHSDIERTVNLIAALACLRVPVSQSIMSQLSTTEQKYNMGCNAAQLGNYPRALKWLEKAEQKCIKYNQRRLTDEELQDELAVIRVQKAYVFQKMGLIDEASKIYTEVQEINLSDKCVLATVANNMMSLRPTINLLEARKKLKIASQASSVSKSRLSILQRRTILLNQALCSLYSNQLEPCRRTIEECQANFGQCKELTMIEAALHIRSNDLQTAIVVLEKDSSDECKLAAVQILLNQGKLEEAYQTINTFEESLASKPAILQLKIALLIATKQEEKALNVLKHALRDASDEHVQFELLQQLAALNTQCGDHKSAAEFLEKLLELRPNNKQILCRLINSYVTFDNERAKQLLAHVLPPETISEANVDALERSNVILYGERYRQKKETKADSSVVVKRKRRLRERKRKLRLPKNYDPSLPPDPERWLPKQERTAYKKKMNKKHRDREIGRGTQGAVGNASPQSEKVPVVKALESPKPGPPQTSGIEGPRQQRPAGVQAKKKKKKVGSKW